MNLPKVNFSDIKEDSVYFAHSPQMDKDLPQFTPILVLMEDDGPVALIPGFQGSCKVKDTLDLYGPVPFPEAPKE